MRLGQRITLPIIVATSLDPKLFTTLTILPAIGIITTNHFLLAPRKRRKLSSCVSLFLSLSNRLIANQLVFLSKQETKGAEERTRGVY